MQDVKPKHYRAASILCLHIELTSRFQVKGCQNWESQLNGMHAFIFIQRPRPSSAWRLAKCLRQKKRVGFTIPPTRVGLRTKRGHVNSKSVICMRLRFKTGESARALCMSCCVALPCVATGPQDSKKKTNRRSGRCWRNWARIDQVEKHKLQLLSTVCSLLYGEVNWRLCSK